MIPDEKIKIYATEAVKELFQDEKLKELVKNEVCRIFYNFFSGSVEPNPHYPSRYFQGIIRDLMTPMIGDFIKAELALRSEDLVKMLENFMGSQMKYLIQDALHSAFAGKE